MLTAITIIIIIIAIISIGMMMAKKLFSIAVKIIGIAIIILLIVNYQSVLDLFS